MKYNLRSYLYIVITGRCDLAISHIDFCKFVCISFSVSFHAQDTTYCSYCLPFSLAFMTENVLEWCLCMVWISTSQCHAIVF